MVSMRVMFVVVVMVVIFMVMGVAMVVAVLVSFRMGVRVSVSRCMWMTIAIELWWVCGICAGRWSHQVGQIDLVQWSVPFGLTKLRPPPRTLLLGVIGQGRLAQSSSTECLSFTVTVMSVSLRFGFRMVLR
jgi:hypothetical protein